MKKNLLLTLISVLLTSLGFSQTEKLWSPIQNKDEIKVSKNVSRVTFPQEFKLFKLNLDNFRQKLVTSPNRDVAKKSTTIITLPNVEGNMERFEMYEASNFDPELQAQFPEIRAYVGIGIDDIHAQLRLSSAPNGIQAMIFRTDKSNEFMESYSEDGEIYAVFKSSREKGRTGFACYTNDAPLISSVEDRVKALNMMRSSVGQLKTMRLALSCTAEYANYFGASSAAQSGLVLAAFNATMTRVNGVYEKDLAIHINLIALTTDVIYYNPATDPYSAATSGQDSHSIYNYNTNWNIELQNTLTSTIGVGNYDIGHLFGASGGGGNAGCIGCVCNPVTTGSFVSGGTTYNYMDGKGMGYTSPSDGIPLGDNFDIDFVSHEMGHQLGANHSFAFGNFGGTENTSVNVEPGSGSTIMGYAGITAVDVQAHSDDYFVYANVLQIQTNLASKTCPVTTTITHGTPVMNAGSDYTIPKGTPFKLTGSGTDSGGNTLSYCWEQNDDATTVGAAVSYPSGTKTNGPNFRSFNPVSVPYRYFPKLETVLANTLSSTWEATSTVARTLNFVLTGRDNVAGGGQTGSDATVVTVSGTVGPFDVTSQATDGISWVQGTNQTISWTVNNTTTLVGSTNVDILLSTDGGLTFSTTLIANTPNDGSEVITVPNVAAPYCRIMVKPTGNIYYDINPKPFAIGYTITSTCNSYTLNFPPNNFQIPDNNTTFTLSSINVPTTNNISDINLAVNLTHTYVSDLQIVLQGPMSPTTQSTIFNRSCTNNDNINATFDDQGSAIVCATTITGNVTPATPLSVFNGLNPNGNWLVGIRDVGAADTGSVASYTLTVCSETATLSTENFGLDNFSLYPNPNNGNFNIQFNSNSTNEIFINVHDMRGREIFSKNYQNSGLFAENLKLDNVQAGVYLVTVQDGNRKEVKKIVVE